MSVRRITAMAALGALFVVSGCSHHDDASTAPTTATTPSGGTASATPSAVDTASAAQLMAKPWPSYTPANSQMEPETVSTAAPITLPASTATSAAGVPIGFPQTPEGALAQLKAIDETGLKNLNQDTARKVYQDSFLPGNPDYYQTGWAGPEADEYGQNDPNTYTTTLTVSQALVRGTAEGGRFVMACVIGKLQVSTKLNGSDTIPVPDCQPMRWNGTRWMGVPQTAVKAPDVSPHSSEAYRLGFRDVQG